MPFIFYDLETTGLEKAFDQIVQFAAIHTDDDLQIRGTINLRCRRLPEIVPSPSAMMVTRIDPDHLENQALSHYQMLQEIQTWLQQRTPATFVGHNSLEFDERFLRLALFRSLCDPYLTSIGGNIRGDIMLLAQAVFHHDPDSIQVPINRGLLNFKLGDLVRANGLRFPEQAAHEALADINATLELARYLRDRAPIIWNQMIDNTKSVQIDELLATHPFVYLSAIYFGRPYGYVVAEVARNLNNPKEVALFDLNHDPRPYLDMSVPDLVRTFGRSPKVFRVVRSNGQPILMPPSHPGQHIRGEILRDELYRERAALIREHQAFQQNVSEALSQRYEPADPSPYVEERLYEGFIGNEDKALMQSLRAQDWPERNRTIQRLNDDRLRELGQRLICTEAPDVAGDEAFHNFNQWVAYRRTTADSVPWLTAQRALVEIDDLARTYPDDQDRINKIRSYITQLADEVID